MAKLCIENNIKLIGKCLWYVWKIEDIGERERGFPTCESNKLVMTSVVFSTRTLRFME